MFIDYQHNVDWGKKQQYKHIFHPTNASTKFQRILFFIFAQMSFKIKLSLLRYFKLFYNKIKKEISKNFCQNHGCNSRLCTTRWRMKTVSKLLRSFWLFFALLIPQIPCQKLCHCHLIKDFFGVKSKPSTWIKSILKISLQHPTLSIYFCFFFFSFLFATYPFFIYSCH